jgi:hypothetical protein
MAKVKKNLADDGGFIGVAAVDHMGHKFDDDLLSTLSAFRDTFMVKDKEKAKELEWYYKNAANIVDAIDNRPDGQMIYKKIKKGDFIGAHNIYKRMVEFAKKISNVSDSKLMAPKNLAMGGMSDLGSYSDGGRLLRGPGDGVSDSIPATIGKGQPARLADGEFVVPARIVSEIGNGSTEAGARKLYKMMDRIQAARGKTVGKGKVAANTKADKYLPA